MHWIPKLHKDPVSFRFAIASKLCFTKKTSKSVSQIFKHIYSQTNNLHKNAKLLSNYNKFLGLRNF